MSKRFSQGAAVVTAQDRCRANIESRRSEISKAKQRDERAVKSPAHALALANKNKSWAKRWLRAHREYLYRNGLIEISI